MTMCLRSIVVAASLLAGGLAAAQPQPAPPPAGKGDAKSLMQSGVRLLEAKDYLGALAVFTEAYARFPSAKILLNIGTTNNLLERKAEAANAYQKYLDSPDADPSKQMDVTTALVDIDKVVGRLEISVTPADAQIQVNDGEWKSAAEARLVRVPAGPYSVKARKDKFGTEGKSSVIDIGTSARVEMVLTAVPEETKPVIGIGGGDVGLIDVVPEPEEPRSRLGGLALGHFDVARGGAALLVGLTADITTPLQLQVAGVIGPTYGMYAGASFAILPGRTRPFVAAGMPVFFSNGARFGVRAAGGVEIQLTRHVSLLAELGAEMMLNPEDNILKAAFIPALGATGRL